MSEDHNLDSSSILVFCRFRPPNDNESAQYKNISIEFYDDNKTLKINPNEDVAYPQEFIYDWIFTPQSSQKLVYRKSSKPIIKAVLEGFNGTVLAYGQTSSGKTYTMMGSDIDCKDKKGIIPRMVRTVFKQIMKTEEKIEFLLKVSYCEIYMENIRDLLNPVKSNLKIRENKTQGIYIENLTDVGVVSEGEVFDLMKFGDKNREVSATNMNAGSSRSHSIFILSVMQTNSQDLSAKLSKLYLVDLAGSEKVGKTNVTGKHLEEAKKINTSLTMLGIVINALTDGKSTHIPYRDSKLTRVLQDSLGGNSKTTLIINCSPSVYNENETLSTLRFGFRAKSIKNKPKINREYSILELKSLLAKAHEELNKKEQVILAQKEALAACGLESGKTSLENSYRIDDTSIEDIKKTELYDEVLSELYDIQEKFKVQSKHFRRASFELETVLIENAEHKKSSIFIYTQIQELQRKIGLLEKSIKTKDEMIENLTYTNEIIQKELERESYAKISLQQQLITAQNSLQNIETYKNQQLENQIIALNQQIEDEKAKNLTTLLDLQKAKENLHKYIQTETTQNEKFQILEKTYKQDKTRWEEIEKKYKDNHQKALEMHLKMQEDIKKQQDQYSKLKSFLNEGEAKILKRSESCEKTLEKLTIMYHQIAIQNSTLNVSKQVLEKKINRMVTENMNLLDENNKIKEKLKILQKLSYGIVSEREKNDEDLKKFKVLKKNKFKKTLKGGLANKDGLSESFCDIVPSSDSYES
ncbi:hypothetical protein SteCoe_7806 [Stentor coeruleus]|uniref:Kinesin-like protein n=1 Tax=Stentor coeruleus TaxID=5963 RepID=A0A1R2CLM6_9CILI|nr:hypothetical protein SteCoe_7806 [Stentor coeruleus]